MGKKKKTGKHTQSSGLRKIRKLNQQMRRLRMKIARWEKNKDDSEKVAPVWRDYQKVRRRPRHNNWDTRGLRKHLELLESMM